MQLQSLLDYSRSLALPNFLLPVEQKVAEGLVNFAMCVAFVYIERIVEKIMVGR